LVKYDPKEDESDPTPPNIRITDVIVSREKEADWSTIADSTDERNLPVNY